MSRLDPRAVKRISGPAWRPLRPQFQQISDQLLAVSPETSAELTTIYVKYQFDIGSNRNVYAVVWLKRSSELVVGLALPAGVISDRLELSFEKRYRNLTAYLTVKPDQDVPPEFPEWAKLAYETALRQQA